MPPRRYVRCATWCPGPTRTWRHSVLPASVWVEVEAAAVEVDRRLEVLPVAEAAGGVPDPLDLRVQAFGRRVGDPEAQVGEDVRQVRLEHPRLLDHGLEPRVGRPEVPVAEEPAGSSHQDGHLEEGPTLCDLGTTVDSNTARQAPREWCARGPPLRSHPNAAVEAG